MNLAEYIKGFLGIIAIIFFGIGIVVWKFRVADEIQEIEKKIDVDTKKVIESDLKVLSDVSFPDEIDVRKMYGVISAGGIQEIEYIKVYEGKYFVKMKFYGEGYFTLEGNHVDIVSVGHVINMKNGQLLYTPQNDDTDIFQ
ncbi:hypothetical protein [Dialister invisus]|uniref:hypothetical protein n=1 Tax=Dialister invisus TaxID=218538 RepID=UPI00235326F1|nr:hypothetical protein [Dialister invisus]